MRSAPTSLDFQSEAEAKLEQFIDLGQAILRQEWQRVKRGA
jgi:hypothetical protein